MKEEFTLVSKMNPPKLALPRFVPFVLKGTFGAVWYDTEEKQYVIHCPKCHTPITYNTLKSAYLEMVLSDRHCCQGCRASITFEKDPGLIGMFLDFWYRMGKFPESDSWIEAVPQSQLNLWEKEIRAALNTAQIKGDG
jgi:hypothetical protein